MKHKRIKLHKNMVWIGIGMIVLFWLLESLIHTIVFHTGTFVEQLVSLDPHELWMRSLVIGIIIIFSVYAQFITRKSNRDEEATKRALAELDQIFNTAADGMCVIDRNFNLLRVNKTFLTIAGISKDEAVSKKCYEMFHGSLCHTQSCPLTRILKGEEHIECKVEKERDDGTRILCLMSVTPFRETEGELIGIIEDFKDITKRKNAEMENEEHHLYLEAVLANAPDAIITMDAHHKIIMCNQVAEKLFGYSKKEMIGKDIDDLIAGADKFGEAKLYSKQVLSGENIPTIETVRYRKDGTSVDVMMAGSQILIGNELVGAVAVYTDITKRKQMEEKIKKYSLELEHKIEELRKVNDELSQYTYAVSHDLRAPLRALNNYCRFLQEDCSNSLDDIGQEYIQGITENVWHMEELVTDLLEYSIIGKTIPKITNLNVGKLLARIVSQLHPDENVKITLPKEDIIIQANEIQMEQLFSNLLSNAFKFNQLSKPHILVEYKDLGDAWKFAVRDNGIGIESRHFNKIFGIFQRLHTQEEYEGTGIGLAIVKKAVEQHGGTIWVESTPGKGSIFTFTLPKIKAEKLNQKTGNAREQI